MRNTDVIDGSVISMVPTQIQDHESIVVGSFSLSCSIAYSAMVSCYSSGVQTESIWAWFLTPNIYLLYSLWLLHRLTSPTGKWTCWIEENIFLVLSLLTATIGELAPWCIILSLCLQCGCLFICFIILFLSLISSNAEFITCFLYECQPVVQAGTGICWNYSLNQGCPCYLVLWPKSYLQL